MILTSYQYNVSYNASLLLEQVWCGYNQAPEKYSAVSIEIGISGNTKCVIWNGFPKSSHIRIMYVYTFSLYYRLHIAALGYMRLHLGTCDYIRLHMATLGYM